MIVHNILIAIYITESVLGHYHCHTTFVQFHVFTPIPYVDDKFSNIARGYKGGIELLYIIKK